jgi:probable F420-dependent oxidoreductase
MRPSIRVDRREPGDLGGLHPLPYDRLVHVGIILPNYDRHASPEGVRAVAETAEELGFDSVWATEHIIVGPEGADPYGRVLEPFSTLAWIAGYTERVGLGTSIVILPLHHPIEVAKHLATLHELSGGRFRLGVGVGWLEEEYRFMGIEFRRRGRRADEALRLMRALWAGEREFHGELWSFENATFEPVPDRPPEIWIGGGSDRAVRRARELGDAWHPSRSADTARIREVKERHAELRVIPRVAVESAAAAEAKLAELEGVGCEGAVLSFGTEPGPAVAAMHELAERRS